MLYLMLVVVFSKLSKRWWFFLLLGWGMDTELIQISSEINNDRIYFLGPPLLLFPITYGVFRNDYVVDDYQVYVCCMD